MKTETNVPLPAGSIRSGANESPGIYIVKLGGSLISHKDEYCTPNMSIIREFGRTLASRWEELRGRLIIVLGGGSYGNGVPHRYNFRNSQQDWKPVDLSIMTVKMFELMSIVTESFREEDLPVYPFQASSLLVCEDGKPRDFFVEPIRHALSMGLLPILSGDMVFDSERRFVIFSSDQIPELFVRSMTLKRVVMLTNVSGVMDHSGNAPRVIARVTRDNIEAVLNQAGASKQMDVSGGMKNKVKALLQIAEMGVESVICDGRNPATLLHALFDSTPPGTVIEPQADNRREGEANICLSPLPGAMGPARLLK